MGAFDSETTQSTLSNARSMLHALQDANQKGDMDVAVSLVSKLQLEFINFKSLPPSGCESPTSQEERLLARETYETAVFIASKLKDRCLFGRNVAQVKLYYFDKPLSSTLPESPNKLPVLGLNLLHLLVDNKLADFHSELERMTCEDRLNPYILFPIQIEQFLMVGCYNQVLQAKERVPHEYYSYFLESLVETVREAISECMCSAYESLEVSEVQNMLMMDSSMSTLNDFIEMYILDWKVENGRVFFKTESDSKAAASIPSMRVLTETLGYATELERIV